MRTPKIGVESKWFNIVRAFSLQALELDWFNTDQGSAYIGLVDSHMIPDWHSCIHVV